MTENGSSLKLTQIFSIIQLFAFFTTQDFIILLSVSFTAILSDDDDDEKVFYKCSPKNLTSGFCKVGDETYDDYGRKNVTYYLSTCSMGEICTEVDENELVYRCRPKISLLEEGEKCQYDGQCKSRLCLNDTCSHLTLWS